MTMIRKSTNPTTVVKEFLDKRVNQLNAVCALLDGYAVGAAKRCTSPSS